MDISDHDRLVVSEMYHVISVLERMGIPFYYTKVNRGAVFLEDSIAEDLSDEEIRALFDGGSVFAAAQPAQEIVKRGFGELLGVCVEPWDGSRVTGECFDDAGTHYCTKQKNLCRLTVCNARTQALSHNFVMQCGKGKLLFPAVTCQTRENGALSVVYCGTPKAEFKYTEGFAFLNESRKRQFIDLLQKANALPVYYKGDAEICLRAGRLKDGRLLTELYNLGFDPLETVDLYLEKAPTSVAILTANGSEQSVSCEAVGNGIYRIGTRAEPMNPVILFIR